MNYENENVSSRKPAGTFIVMQAKRKRKGRDSLEPAGCRKEIRGDGSRNERGGQRERRPWEKNYRRNHASTESFK